MSIREVGPDGYTWSPPNFSRVDKHLSRCAQPEIQNFSWLKDVGHSDIITLNSDVTVYKTMNKTSFDITEAEIVKHMNMKFHQIPLPKNCNALNDVSTETQNGCLKNPDHKQTK